MKYKTVKAKKIYKYLFDDCGKFYRIYNSMSCYNRGYYLLKSYKDGYLVINQLHKRIKLPYWAQRKLIDFVENYYPHCKSRIQKEKDEL